MLEARGGLWVEEERRRITLSRRQARKVAFDGPCAEPDYHVIPLEGSTDLRGPPHLVRRIAVTPLSQKGRQIGNAQFLANMFTFLDTSE